MIGNFKFVKYYTFSLPTYSKKGYRVASEHDGKYSVQCPTLVSPQLQSTNLRLGLHCVLFYDDLSFEFVKFPYHIIIR